MKKTISHSKKGPVLVAIALIILLGLSVYINSLNGEFVWDDGWWIRDNVYIKSWSYIPKIFTENLGVWVGKKNNFYRPLQVFTYMVDYHLWKLDVKGYHLTNILLHVLVALSIYWVINILYGKRLLSLFTSMLFIVHPIHTEAVAYISGRTDPLAVLFMLLSVIFYLKYYHVHKISFYILMCLSYILALLSREISLILPVLLLVYHYSSKKRLSFKEFLPILSVTSVYILLRLTVLKFSPAPTLFSTTLLQRTPGFFVAITNYIRLLFLPFDLHMEYKQRVFEFGNPKAILGILILFSLLIYAFRVRKKDKLAFFSICWFFITLLPVSNLYPINAYMAEHWLYAPSIGFFLILAKFLTWLYDRKKTRIITIVFITSLLGFYSYLTIRQNVYWRDPLTFYERTLKYAPDSSRIHYNLGIVYKKIKKDTEIAISEFKKAIEIKPDYPEAYYNLGIVYKDIGKKEKAIASYKKAIKIKPGYAKAYHGLGNTYAAMKKKEEAITSFKKAIELKPDYAEAYNNLGIAYNSMGKKEEAIDAFRKAVENKPDYAKAYYNLATVYKGIGEKEKAIASYKKAVEIKPDYAKVYYNLSLIYFSKEQYKLAIEYCNKAKNLGFTNPKLLETLKPYREQLQLGQ